VLRLSRFSRKGSTPSKRALLSYLVAPAYDFSQGHAPRKFSNDGLVVTWATVLADMGYAVDVLGWDDTTFEFDGTYDLVAGHGGMNFDQLAAQFRDTPFIYISSGSYWKYHNEAEQNRYSDFKRRHGVELPHDRYIDNPEEAANRRASAIIGVGNAGTAATYSDFKDVRMIPIGSFTDVSKVPAHDVAAGRNSFLFVAGSGNIHKGLDLVLDAFAGLPEFNLHVYTFMDDAFAEFYKDQLALPNVTVHDFVPFPSPEFQAVTAQCDYAIMPSCSEGSPGSIVEAMAQGLIPIVSEAAHIDVGDAGIDLSDVSVSAISEAAISIATESDKSLRKRSEAAKRIIADRHAPGVFRAELRKAIESAVRA
jgi:glycosyltransferase involved in cell wall biosynthesis